MSLQDAMARVEKMYGKGSLINMSEAPKIDKDALSTGIIGLDWALGIGGLPLGRVVELYGQQAVGKSTIALSTVAEAQKKGIQCVYIDAEHALNVEFAKMLGVDPDKLVISQPSCVSEESMVLTQDGYKKIKTLIPGKDVVVSVNEHGIGEHKGFKLVNFQEKKCYEICTSSGVLTASGEHKVKTFNGWKEVLQLNCGDQIETPLRTSVFSHQTSKITRQQGTILGMLIADGTYIREHIRFIKTDIGILSWVQEYIEKNYDDVVFKKLTEKNYSFTKKVRCNKANEFSKFVHCHLGYESRENKKMPADFYYFSDDAIAGLLCGLWSCDGSMSQNGNMEFSTISENVAYGVMAILHHFGIVFSYMLKIDKRKATYKPLHRIVINNKEGLFIFKNKIGTIGRIQITEEIVSNKKSYIRFPKEIWGIIFEEILKKYPTLVSFYNVLFGVNLSGHHFNTKRGVSNEYLIKINSLLQSDKIEKLLSSDVCYRPIKRINEAGNKKVFDIYVEDNHNFICNSCVVHNCGEEALNIVEMLVSSGDVRLIIIDSVAALVPKAELDGEMGDQQMGLQARLISKALRKLTAIMNGNKCTIIFINQLRSTIQAWGPSEVTTGGKALQFYATIRLEAKKGEVLKQGENIIGHEIKVKVTKNKVAPPYKTCSFELNYTKGISSEGMLLDAAVDKGIIKKTGSWYSYDDNKIGQGAESAKNWLAEHQELKQEIINGLFKVVE